MDGEEVAGKYVLRLFNGASNAWHWHYYAKQAGNDSPAAPPLANQHPLTPV